MQTFLIIPGIKHNNHAKLKERKKKNSLGFAFIFEDNQRHPMTNHEFETLSCVTCWELIYHIISTENLDGFEAQRV